MKNNKIKSKKGWSIYYKPFAPIPPTKPSEMLSEYEAPVSLLNEYITSSSDYYDPSYFSGNFEIDLSKIPNEGILRIEAHSNSNELNIAAVVDTIPEQTKNPKYEQQLIEYKENLKLHRENLKAWREEVKLWAKWVEQEKLENKIKQKATLEKRLERISKELEEA